MFVITVHWTRLLFELCARKDETKGQKRERRGRGERREAKGETKEKREGGEEKGERGQARETTSPFIRRPAAAHTVPGPPGLQRLRQEFRRDFMNPV